MVMIFEPNSAARQKSNYTENQLESYETTNLISALVGAGTRKQQKLKELLPFSLTPRRAARNWNNRKTN